MPGHAKPLAAPTLPQRHGLSAADLRLPPEIIATMPVRHEETREHWRQWFAAAGLAGADVSSGAVFHEAGVLVEVAMASHGVVLGRAALAQGLVDQGLLPVLNDRPVGTDASYWLCYPGDRSDDPAVAASRAFVFAADGAACCAYRGG